MNIMTVIVAIGLLPLPLLAHATAAAAPAPPAGCLGADDFFSQHPITSTCAELRRNHELRRAVTIREHSAAEIRGRVDTEGELLTLAATALRTAAVVVEPAAQLTVRKLALVGASHGFIRARMGAVRLDGCRFVGNGWPLVLPAEAGQQQQREHAQLWEPSGLVLSAAQLSAAGAAAATASFLGGYSPGTGTTTAARSGSLLQQGAAATLGTAALCLLQPGGTAQAASISNQTYSSSAAGSAVSQTGGQLEITDCRFESNIASDGGAIYYDGLNAADAILLVEGCAFDMNEARGNTTNGPTAGHGGAIFVKQTLQASALRYVKFENSTFTQNLAVTDTNSGPLASRGGAIYIEDAASDTIGCLFESNGAFNTGTNKAVYKATGGAVAIKRVDTATTQWVTTVGSQVSMGDTVLLMTPPPPPPAITIADADDS
eukprot:SAG22_NODE_68_length_22846_cov_32.458258_13_plen_432_part_00